MLSSFILFAAGIACIPIFLVFDGAIIQALITAYAAIILGAAALFSRPNQLDNFRRLFTWVAIAAIVPAAWMIIQTLPLGFLGLGHPIWASASTALGTTLPTSISLDIGATWLAAGRYLGFVGLALAVTLAAVDRRNAELILLTLLAVATAEALLVLVGPAIAYKPQYPSPSDNMSALATVLGIGCIAGVAAMRWAYERGRTRSEDSAVFRRTLPGIMVAGIAAALCLVALVRVGRDFSIAATCISVGLYVSLFVVRRFRFGMWGMAAVVIAFATIAAGVFHQFSTMRFGSLLLALSDPRQGALSGLTSRLLEDARWSGSGAGTFLDVAQLYRDVDFTANAPYASTTVAQFVIELGRPMLILVGVGVFALIFVFLSATIRRGRDSYFPAMGAASLCLLFLLAFSNAGLLTSAPAMMASVVVGLALAQTTGRRRAEP